VRRGKRINRNYSTLGRGGPREKGGFFFLARGVKNSPADVRKEKKRGEGSLKKKVKKVRYARRKRSGDLMGEEENHF